MSYSTISNWNVTSWTDEMEALARDKFVPMIMSSGASKVQMLRTGDLSFSVVTEYEDADKAEKAQSRIAEIRSQATTELPMTMADVSSGTVFAKG
ncbi:MAG: hypothetical protein KUA43_01250 [Hoeflea sp.]|nr:hypothetical protein [Alphaproteobacteria bacterium]MBV1722053.1 hypothetical protein [Hoeflea sp.]MBU4545250.1 hypothetical protein [Alphaproteobacteria bacterium]MBU4548899.1 hypothetical protein [Alphaproteobacteria bacterium]MBV1761403.1 hypothetical protein [Hoeflea sp.]